MKYPIIAVILVIFFILVIKRRKKGGSFKDIIRKAIKSGGIIKKSEISNFSDPGEVKTLLNRMFKDGIAILNVASDGKPEYIFASLPEKYSPVAISSPEDFNDVLTQMGSNDPDGQIFMSEVVAAFDMEYDEIIDLTEAYSENVWVTKNISKSGNTYLMFDKSMMN